MNNINYDYKFFEFLGVRINQNDEKLKELLKDENVRKFVNLLDENRRLSLSIKNGMEECSHAFVMTEVCEEGNVVYHCLKCGLTNEYAVKMDSKVLTQYEIEISDIFKKTFAKGVIVGIADKLSVAREVYDFIKRENSSISNAELQEAFARVYPKFVEIREKGTLGKCKQKKSAAQLWYEMEERCEAKAIATLNKIVEDNKRKIK